MAVFALLGETPFLALGSNTSKIQSLLDDVFGAQGRVIGLEQLVGPGLRVQRFTDAEQAMIRAYRASAILQRKAMFDHIAQAAALRGTRQA